MSGQLRIADGFALPVDVLTEAIGIVATRGAGKSSTSVVLIEEAHAAGVQVVVVDPTGVYYGLRTAADGNGDGLPFYVFGGPHGDLPLEPAAGKLLADVAVDNGPSLVLDVSDFSKAKARAFVADFLERLYERKARARTTLLLVLDEADEWAPQLTRQMRGEAPRCLGAVETIVKRGRSRGIGAVLISQRTQAINKDVLDLVDTMFAMRLGAPRSRATVAEWLEVKEATDEQGVIASLSSLPTGTAWVWSPVRGLLERIKVRRIRTFDSYRTPKPGERLVEPAARAELDLDALGEQMAATVERAKENDPAELRRRIRELEQKNFRLNTVPQIELMDWARSLFGPLGVKEPREGSVEVYLNLIEARVAELAAVEPTTVEVPVVGKDDLAQLRAAVSKADAFAAHAAGLGAAIRENVAPLVAALDRVSAAAKVPPVEVKARSSGESGRRGAGTPPAKAERRAATVSGSGVDGGSNGTVTNPEQRILDGLAWLEALGIRPGDRVQVAFLAGYKPKGGYFGNLLGALRTNGLVDYPQTGTVELTEEGRAIAVDPGLPRTSEALHEAVLARLSGPQGKLLRTAIDAYPDAVSRAEIGEQAGYDPAGGYFGNLLGSLRSLGLVAYPASGMVVARDILFPR